MYILYLDESGNPEDPADRFFVLGGAAIFERQTYYVSQALDRIQTQHFPGQPPVEFHASKIRSGDGFGEESPNKRGRPFLLTLSGQFECLLILG